MASLIDKSALVAEIDRRLADNKKEIECASYRSLEDYFEGYEDALTLFKDQYLDTLEVKEVDLEKEKDDYWNKLCDSEFGELLERDAKWFDDIAKHFFELGLKAQKGE